MGDGQNNGGILSVKKTVGGHRKIGRAKLRWKRPEGETSKDRRSTRPENVETENLMR